MTTDILFDPVTGDILIADGELVVGDSTDQHTNDLLVMDKGWHKFAPRLGVGVHTYVNEQENFVELTRAIRTELHADGQEVLSVIIGPGNLNIQTSYP